MDTEPPPGTHADLALPEEDRLRLVFDPEFYLSCHPDVRAAGVDPFEHFRHYGAAEGRPPNYYFDPAFYLQRYPDVAALGINALTHYLQHGGEELRDPHPEFDAAFYVDRHPEAARNPLIHYLLYGSALGYEVRRTIRIADYLPSDRPPLPVPDNIVVDIIIPAYRGLGETQRCLQTVLADPHRPPGRVIVIDDKSPEPKLSAALAKLADAGQIMLIRNETNLGFVASVNRGIAAAGQHDIVLLNSDTEVPPGWLQRLAAHAYAGPRIASVSPFSNNATICSYPAIAGGPPPFALPVAALDAACREANAGRHVNVPVTVGFAMYIRHAALADVGDFDAESFGRGYGEESDFCMRAAARGWTHRLACDVYVHHEGEVSFGPKASEQRSSQDILRARYPSYDRVIDRHIRVDDAHAARFATTAAILRRSGLPTILAVSHSLGGGVGHHIDDVANHLHGRANLLLLESGPEGAAITVPAVAGHPRFAVSPPMLEGAAAWLASAGVARVHVHHLLGLDLDLRRLIALLGVPFDVTVHDWFTICPQTNLLPHLDAHYCREPGPAVCNTCIANRPSHDAHDILSWRSRFRWLFAAAERVFCPSQDVRQRLARYGLDARAIVVPHEPVESASWNMVAPPPLKGRKLRIALIGVLADQKGLPTVLALADAAPPDSIELHLVGYTEKPLAPHDEGKLRQTGRYRHADLAKLLARIRPHAIWFPAQWPETFSSALAAGLPIIAADIGAFPERLAGRPLTWLVPPDAPTADWLATFDGLRAALLRQRGIPRGRPRTLTADYYQDEYLPARPARGARSRPLARPAVQTGPIDVRRPDRTTVVVVPERLDNGALSPCAFIRLLLPLDHPAAGAGIDVLLASPAEALRYRADAFATQRYAILDPDEAEALIAHAAASATPLVYDLDDDLVNIPDDHPEAAVLRPRAAVVSRLARAADLLLVSTPGLRARLAPLRRDAVLVPNGLDERLWSTAPPAAFAPRRDPVRILLMGTATHDADFAAIIPALARICETFPDRVTVEVIGMTAGALPPWAERVVVPAIGGGSYPAFITWITQLPAWHIGITPLADTDFNASKSAIKTMDYAALGLAVLASDVPAYRGSLADGPGGALVRNDPAAWYWAIAELIRNPHRWQTAAQGARAALLAHHTLAAQAAARQAVWRSLAPRAARKRAFA
jgi:GT2 family glycosyltransferase/glycosyltransferase involved in cell wall biosynthesis